MFYVIPYQKDPEPNQATHGTESDNPIEGSSTTQQVTTAIPATLTTQQITTAIPTTLKFFIQPIQVKQQIPNNIELCKTSERIEEVVKGPEKILKTTNLPSTSSLPAKEPEAEENTNETDIKGCRCGICWITFPTLNQLQAHKCPKGSNKCRCTLCITATKAVRTFSQIKYKRCSLCSTYYKCVIYLKKHVDKYHGSNTCGVCGTKFKTRLLCCKHLCRGSRKDSKETSEKCSEKPSKKSSKKSLKTPSLIPLKKPLKKPSKKPLKKPSKKSSKKYSDSEFDSDLDSDFNFDSHSESESDIDSDSDAIDEQTENIEVDNTNTSTNEVLQDNDIEIEYIIESERPDSPPITFTSIQKKEDYLRVSEDAVKRRITSETPVLEIEVVTTQDSDNESNFNSGNIDESEILNTKYDIQQGITDKTDDAMPVSSGIKTVENVAVKNAGIKTNPNETDLTTISSSDKDATKTNTIITYSDNEAELDSINTVDLDESITSEAELDSIEGNESTDEILDTDISESTDDAKNDELYRKRKNKSDKSRSNDGKSKSKKTKVIQCSICSEVFYDQCILNYHIEEEHSAATDDNDIAKPIQQISQKNRK